MANSNNVTAIRPEFADFATPAPDAGFDFNDFKRKAGDMPLRAMEVVGLAGPNRQGKLTPRMGRLAGIGTLLALMDAGSRLADPNESATRNMLQAGGALAGDVGGGLAGGLIGATLMPFAPPLGMLIGSAIGASAVSPFGEGLGGMLAGVVEGSPESNALKAERRKAEAAIELEAKRMATLLPYEQAAADMAARQEARQAALANDARLRESINQSFREQSQNAAQQQAAMTQAILGGRLL